MCVGLTTHHDKTIFLLNWRCISSKVHDYGKRYNNYGMRDSEYSNPFRIGVVHLLNALTKYSSPDSTAIEERYHRPAYMYIYTCHEKILEFECGFVVNKRLSHIVSGFTPVNDGVGTVRFKGKFNNVLRAQDSAEDRNDAVKDAF